MISALTNFYKVEVDWKGELYCGITLDWHYDKGYVDISMPNYVKKQLLRYKQTTPRRHQDCSFEPNAINYGKKLQSHHTQGGQSTFGTVRQEVHTSGGR